MTQISTANIGIAPAIANGSAPAPVKLDTFTKAYIECALWSSIDDEGEPLDQSEAELAPATQAQMAAECADFQSYASALLAEAKEQGETDEQAGHDFWLTRNGHGAGFWDRGLGDVGRKLSDASKTFGSCNLYIGDDGMIYCM